MLLMLAEAAATLRLHPVTLRALAAAGELPAFKIGRAWRFVEIDLVAWARAHYRRADAVGDKESKCRSTDVRIAASGGPRSAYRTEVAYAVLVAPRTGKKRRNGSITCAPISGASTVSANGPAYTWQDAVVRWCNEKAYKATALEDRAKFQWLDGYLRGRLLHTITRDEIQAIGEAKARESSRATANRYLALVRAVLKRAAGPWQWIEKAPAVTLYLEAKRRVRWLTKQEATRLLDALPTHQKQLTRFALATGLRQANVLALKWPDVDIERRTAWVHADEAKGGEAIGVPLNDEAVAVLREELGKHPLRVFTFNGRPLGQANTRAWEECARAP